MKKFQLPIILSLFLLLVWHHQSVQAEISKNEAECLLQKMAYADGSFSEKEKQHLQNTIQLPKDLIAAMKDDCLRSKEQITADLSNYKDDPRFGIVLIFSSYIAKADGTVTSDERRLLTLYLDTVSKENDVQKLLDLCTVEAISNEEVFEQILLEYFPEKYKKTKRGEVPLNLKGIKTVELAYEATFDVYVTAAPYPEKSSGDKTKKWSKGSSGGFATLGWSPDGDVRGTYWVTTTVTNFTAYGIIDVDGDGVFATYKATKSENPNVPITGPDVY
jgi:uncharacterized tellurite resistance protein B-like protein